MYDFHKLILYAALGIFGISLLIPGLIEIFKHPPGSRGLLPTTINGNNQFRTLNGMMAGIGVVALWAVYNLDQARVVVRMLGVILLMVVLARFYSFIVDGFTGAMALLYFVIEVVLTILFLAWPPR